jgi:ABC-type branched-subunit amino acid transport system ATPase component
VSASPILEVSGLFAGYDNVPVVRELSLSAAAGEIVALLGANGAGKTTTLRAISTGSTSAGCPRLTERAPGSPTFPKGAGSSTD